MKLRDLTTAVGTEVTGLDLRMEPSDDTKRRLRAAWYDRYLVLVRGQQIDLDDQRRFAECFGPLNTRFYPDGAEFNDPRTLGDQASDPAFARMYISNTEPDGVGGRAEGIPRHQDHISREVLTPGICLYAEEVPSTGGDTIFVNTNLAYQRLPAELKRRVAALDATHCTLGRPGSPRATHPVCIRHPANGHPLLFVNERNTERIEGLTEDESRELLDRLLVCFDDDDVVYRHHWESGDVVMWDNIGLQHARTPFDPTARRSMRRLQVGAATRSERYA